MITDFRCGREFKMMNLTQIKMAVMNFSLAQGVLGCAELNNIEY